MIKYTQQSFHKNCKFMFTSIYNRILNYCNSVYKSPSSKTVKKMKEESARWFIDLLQQRYSTGTSDSPCIHTGNKCVIIMVDNTIYNPGLADKLRGILSIYSLCKEKHIDFKINWTYPFELTEYMLPNKINWIIEQEKIKYSLSDSKIVVIDTLPNIHASRQSIIDKKITLNIYNITSTPTASYIPKRFQTYSENFSHPPKNYNHSLIYITKTSGKNMWPLPSDSSNYSVISKTQRVWTKCFLPENRSY